MIRSRSRTEDLLLRTGGRPGSFPPRSAISDFRLVLLDEFEQLIRRVLAVVGPGADLPEHAGASEDLEALERW